MSRNEKKSSDRNKKPSNFGSKKTSDNFRGSKGGAKTFSKDSKFGGSKSTSRDNESNNRFEKKENKFGGKLSNSEFKSKSYFERKGSKNSSPETNDNFELGEDRFGGAKSRYRDFNKKDDKFSPKGPKNPKGSEFDTRDKYVGGERKFGAKKPYKKFEDDADRVKSYIQKRKFDKIASAEPKDSIRLNKYIANAGICSRREADELITQGLVTVNGVTITEMGYQVQKTDRVIFDGQGILPEKPVYVLLNKPKGYISTTKDEKARKTVMDLVANASPYRVYPVGRLDRQTTGVILLTNDGLMTKKLTHPSFNMKKIYHVTLDRKLNRDDLNAIAEGVRLEEGVLEVDSISYIEGKPKNEIGIEIHSGWNRVVRRVFQKLGYEVEALDRVMFAGLTKKNIKRGHWRILTDLEVNNLKML